MARRKRATPAVHRRLYAHAPARPAPGVVCAIGSPGAHCTSILVLENETLAKPCVVGHAGRTMVIRMTLLHH